MNGSKLSINTWGICISDGCGHPTPPGHAFCETHWGRIPHAIRRRLYKRGYGRILGDSSRFLLELGRRLSSTPLTTEVLVGPSLFPHFPVIKLDILTKEGAFYCFCGAFLGRPYTNAQGQTAINLTPEAALAFCNHCINLASPNSPETVDCSHEQTHRPDGSGDSKEGGVQRPQLPGSEEQQSR